MNGPSGFFVSADIRGGGMIDEASKNVYMGGYKNPNCGTPSYGS